MCTVNGQTQVTFTVYNTLALDSWLSEDTDIFYNPVMLSYEQLVKLPNVCLPVSYVMYNSNNPC